MEAAVAFSFLGFGFGVLFDFVTALGKSINIKWITFLLDFLLTVFSSVVLGCVMIAYSNGNFKGWFFTLSVLVFVIYLLTLHRILYPLFSAVFLPIRKILKKIAKKLKNNEKSLKKVLQFDK